MADPWLSVLMPTYNGAESIGQTFESVALQDEQGIECILVDDGSQDDTIKIAQEYSKSLPINIVQLPEVTGNWVLKTNVALSKAKAEHVCLLFQDDIWLEGRLSNLKKLIQDAPDAALYLHSAHYVDPQNKKLCAWQCPLQPFPEEYSSEELLSKLLVQNFIASPAPTFKRSIAQEIGGLNEDLKYTADWDFWIRLASKGRTVFLDKELSGFRILPTTETIRQSQDSKQFRAQLDQVLYEYLPLLDDNKALQNRTKLTGELSNIINVSIASLFNRKMPAFFSIFKCAILAGPSGCFNYFRYSTIRQRMWARIKAQIAWRFSQNK